MKKRIFIALQYMEIGGVERSLIGMLDAIDYTKNDVDLFIYDHRGDFMKYIPQYVRLLPENKAYAAINRPIVEALREGHVSIVLARLLAKVQYAVYNYFFKPDDYNGVFQYVADCVSPLLPSLKQFGKYDLAISYLTPHNIVKDKVLADEKYAWVHSDYSTISVNAKKELPVWKGFDKIIAVSEDVRKAFGSTFPTLKDKIYVMENILSPQFVRAQAMLSDVSHEMPRLKNEYILCSVGRFSPQKNFENIPFICRYLKNMGVDFKWYLIGYGGDEGIIKKNIEDTGMQDVCIILGKKSNPYPYMAACDFYIQPSRYEGKAVTVREAQMLYRPVVITRFATSSSQLKENVDGVIVPLDNEGAAVGINDFIHDADLQDKIVSYLKAHDYGNESEVKKIAE